MPVFFYLVQTGNPSTNRDSIDIGIGICCMFNFVNRCNKIKLTWEKNGTHKTYVHRNVKKITLREIKLERNERKKNNTKL